MSKTFIWLTILFLSLTSAPMAWADSGPIPWEKAARYLPPEVVRQIEADGGADGLIDLTLNGDRGYLKYLRSAAPGRPAQPYSREVLLRLMGDTIQVRPGGPRANPKAAGRYWSLGFPRTRQGRQVLVVPGHGSDNFDLPITVLAWPPRPESRRDTHRVFN